MKRDMELFRKFLLEVETIPPDMVNWVGLTVEGYSPDEVAYHARLAHDAGFIEARFLPGTNDFTVRRLTYAGHEFLDAAREDTLWQKAKQTVLSNAGTLTVEALKTALAMLMQQAAHGKIA
jgi:hypothetical protein